MNTTRHMINDLGQLQKANNFKPNVRINVKYDTITRGDTESESSASCYKHVCDAAEDQSLSLTAP